MSRPLFSSNDTAPTEIYTLSLHDALPIYWQAELPAMAPGPHMLTLAARASHATVAAGFEVCQPGAAPPQGPDRKSTRLNSSHMSISYAVFCLKKKKRHKKHAQSAHGW